MGYTNKELTEKWHAERDRANQEQARAAELQGKLAAVQDRNSELEKLNGELEDKLKASQARMDALEEQIKFHEAATKSANEDANEQRAKVAKLEAQLKAKKERLSPGAQDLISHTKHDPDADIISTDAIIHAAASVASSSEKDTRFLNVFLAASASEPEVEERSYIELTDGDDEGNDDDDEEGDDDEEEEEPSESGAPYGRSPDGEYLDPDEA
jgi:DNA repair exonuclease SbcCD ATPase subunit